MATPLSTYKLIESIVNDIDNSFAGSSVTETAPASGFFKVFTSDTFWLTVGKEILLDGELRKITDIQPNEWIIVTNGTIPTVLTSSIDLPNFFHGTVRATNEELKLEKDVDEKYPMIYLHEVTREVIVNDFSQRTGRRSPVDLYFMVDHKREDSIAKHFRYAIEPMRNLAYKFWETCIASGIINTQELEQQDYTLLDLMRWGRYQDLKGNTEQLFADGLSGVKMEIELPFLKKSLECLC